MFLSAEKYGQCKTKCDTVSDSVLHIGHIRNCFFQGFGIVFLWAIVEGQQYGVLR